MTIVSYEHTPDTDDWWVMPSILLCGIVLVAIGAWLR